VQLTGQIKKNGRRTVMAVGVKHYFKNGTEYKGPTHKDSKGMLMSGAKHTASSKNLYHKKDMSSNPKKKV
jgi:hypothetical protein